MFVLHNSPKLEKCGATHASKPDGTWHVQNAAKILVKRNLICKIQAALWYFNGVTIKGYENYLSCFSFIAPSNFMQLHSSSTEPMHLLSVFCDALSSSSLCLSVFLNSRMKKPKHHLFGFSLFIPSLCFSLFYFMDISKSIKLKVGRNSRSEPLMQCQSWHKRQRAKRTLNNADECRRTKARTSY